MPLLFVEKSERKGTCNLNIKRNIISGEDESNGQILINLKYLSHFPQQEPINTHNTIILSAI